VEDGVRLGLGVQVWSPDPPGVGVREAGMAITGGVGVEVREGKMMMIGGVAVGACASIDSAPAKSAAPATSTARTARGDRGIREAPGA
jgi:hypothetical protein